MTPELQNHTPEQQHISPTKLLGEYIHGELQLQKEIDATLQNKDLTPLAKKELQEISLKFKQSFDKIQRKNKTQKSDIQQSSVKSRKQLLTELKSSFIPRTPQ